MKLINIKKALLSFGLVILSTLAVNAQQSLWVGQSYTFDVSSSVMGITANMSWSTSGGYLSLSGSGFYRTITVTQYFSGEATVTCEWDYRLTGSGSYTHTKRQVRIKCRDNQVSIYPTSITMAQGETQYVTYSHQYDNQYTYSADAYFQSTNPSIVSVNQHTGELKALKEGVAYINVYSKISSTTPTCKVIVQKVNPTAINIPASLSLEVGETKNLNAVLTPSNAISNLTWHSNDNSISTVTQKGEVTGVHHGNSVITVSTENGLSAKCNVSVSKSQLKLFSNCDDGLYEAGHQLTLSSNVVNAEIFYTTDEADPTINSIKYTKP
ncbi:MAG: Ig-like domain-containing protein, partial [Muribaculaceae bacterium]|nr:Ig-like domain-containing protein [Muribaculaceae bacterium]